MCRFNPTTLVAGLGSMLGTNTGARSGHDRKSTRDEAGCLHRCFGDWKTLWPLLSIPMPFAIQWWDLCLVLATLASLAIASLVAAERSRLHSQLLHLSQQSKAKVWITLVDLWKLGRLGLIIEVYLYSDVSQVKLKAWSPSWSFICWSSVGLLWGGMGWHWLRLEGSLTVTLRLEGWTSLGTLMGNCWPCGFILQNFFFVHPKLNTTFLIQNLWTTKRDWIEVT
jgi:hypothetical protein